MVLTRSILAAASVFSVGLAQVIPIAFTSVPAVAVVGSLYNVTWGGGDGFSGVTLTLRKGSPSNLATIGILADGIDENYYLWTVSEDLETASDYALQITQGQSDINYSGLFSIVGGTGSSSLSFSGLTSSTRRPSNVSTTATATGLTGTGSLAGTGTALPRNTTFSSQTMPRTTSSDFPAFTSHASRTEEAAATSAAETAAATTSAPNSGRSMQVGSSAALVMGLFAAIICLN